MPRPVRPTRAARRLAPCLAALLLSGCTTESGQAPDSASRTPTKASRTREVPLDVVSRGGQTIAFVPVSINGKGPFRFVLDTGASSSAVDDDVARQLRLPRTGRRQPITGVVGTQQVPVVELHRWKVGTIRLAPADATVIDMRIQKGGPDIQGLLGSDVLSRFGSITVDYRHEVLRLPAD